jgi:hypothetical protein
VWLLSDSHILAAAVAGVDRADMRTCWESGTQRTGTQVPEAPASQRLPGNFGSRVQRVSAEVPGVSCGEGWEGSGEAESRNCPRNSAPPTAATACNQAALGFPGDTE